MEGFVIEFVEGERKGQTVLVAETLLLGRSHSAGVQLSAPEVSGKHLQLEVRGGVCMLSQKGSGRTWLNGEPVAPGAERAVKAGDKVALAGGNAFRVLSAEAEEADFPTAGGECPAADSQSGGGLTSATRGSAGGVFQVDDGTGGVDTGTLDESGTQEMYTVAYTPEAEAALAEKSKAAARKRVTWGVVAAALLAATAGGGAWVSKSRTENPLTWPVGADGKAMYFDKWVDIGDPGLAETCGFFTPGSGVLNVDEQPDAITVETRIGKRQDVPARFSLMRNRSPGNLTTDREKGFAAWREKRIAEGWTFELLSGIKFTGRENGVPYRVAKYTRNHGGMSWSGFAQYLKFRDWEWVLLKEIPDAEWYRGKDLLGETAFLLTKPAFVAAYWEPDGTVPRRPVESLLDDAARALAPEETSGQMLGNAMNMLRGALTLALARDDRAAAVRGMKLLQELRRRQTAEYNDRLREFELAKGTGRIKLARSLRTTFWMVFSDENDKRYHDLRNGDLLGLAE